MPENGEARVSNCRKCGAPIVVVYEHGLRWVLSSMSVPLKDGVILAKYIEPVFNVWQIATAPDHPIRLRAVQWWGPTPPSRGRLYVRHLCGARP